ncbi:MAG: choice-of-anchor D domain-containing protein [Coleofasciculaceae cyanobacterium]
MPLANAARSSLPILVNMATLCLLIAGIGGVWYFRNRPVSSPAVASLSFSLESLDFQEWEVGSLSPAQTVVVTNNYSSSLKIEPSLDGTNLASFKIATNSCAKNAPINPGDECIMGIRFLPKNTGRNTAILLISHNTADSPQRIQLSGVGTEQPLPDISFSNDILDFGKQKIKTNSSVKKVTLTNIGLAPFQIYGVTFSGSDKEDFALVSDSCSRTAPIAPKDSCEIGVRFAPQLLRDRSANLKITSNAFGGEPSLVALSGTGIAPEINLSSTVLSFKYQEVDTSSQYQTITLSNQGEEPLRQINISLAGNHSNDFSFEHECPNDVLPPGSSCSVRVNFIPKSEGKRSTQLNIISDTLNEAMSIKLTGTGLNRPPVAKDDVSKLVINNPGQKFVISVLANDHDPDGDQLNLNVIQQPSFGSASVEGGKVIYQLFQEGYQGASQDSFIYQISDGKSGKSEARVTISLID